MFLTDHTGLTLHYGEEKHKMIVTVTALIFNTGIIYHIGYENGDVEVRDILNGPAVYLGQESFKLPDVRLTTLEVDFTQVVLMSNRYGGSVTVGNDTYTIPSRPEGLGRYNFLDDPEFISRYVRNTMNSSECNSVVQERDNTQPSGEPLTYGSAENRNIQVRARDDTQFERVRYVIDDDFTVRAVPEENISWE